MTILLPLLAFVFVSLLAYAAMLPIETQNGSTATHITARRTRLYALQAMILGGPDGQVM